MTGIVLVAPDLAEPATGPMVSGLMVQGAFGAAFSGMVVVAGNAAIQVVQKIGGASQEWPDFEAAALHERFSVAATAARAIVDRRRTKLSPTDLERAEAAVQVLEAIAAIHARTQGGAPGDSAAMADFVGELILLGVAIGQGDTTLSGPMRKVLRDAERQKRQGGAPAPQVAAGWHASALALAKALCAADPAITTSQLAAQIDRDPGVGAPSFDVALKFVREERKAARLPARVTR